jgi:ureidoglycolate lyase
MYDPHLFGASSMSHNMNRQIIARPLTREAFAPFGDVIDKPSYPDRIPINGGRARRLPPMAEATVRGEGGRVSISLVEGDPYTFPLQLDLVERHPLGSQAFIPLSPDPFVVIVCPDENNRPGTPQAFLAAPGQGVNYHPNVWHGVLTPLVAQDFLIVDRAGEGVNLEKWRFTEPWTVLLG